MKQFGRSMVEMLGVLAIIGVLSIGAISGYNISMNKYRANDTITELTTRAVLLGQQLNDDPANTELADFDNETNLGYPITVVTYDEYPNLFGFELTNVPVAVCEQILNADWLLPVAIKVNDIPFNRRNTGICENDDGSDPKMLIEFDKDLNAESLGSGRCEVDEDCGNCEKCEETVCTSACIGNERCAKDVKSGNMVCCPRDNRVSGFCCASTVNGKCCNEAGQCCNYWKPLIDKSGNCYACDTTSTVDVTGVESNCNVCGNREVWEYQKKSLCAPSCPSTKPLRDNSGNCYSCTEPEPVQISMAQQKPAEYCTDICPNRIVGGARNRRCMLPCEDEQFIGSDGKCYPCDTKENMEVAYVDPKDCETNCPGIRKLFDTVDVYYATCVLPCEDGQFRGDDGVCYDCDDTENPSVKMHGALNYCAAACPGVREAGGFYNRRCILSCGNGNFTGSDGKCYPCDTKENVDVSNVDPKDCETNCQGIRKLFDSFSNYATCVLPCEDGQFRGDDGVCYDCDDTENPSVKMYGASSYCAAACSGVRQAGGFHNRRCMLPCGTDSFIDTNGFCYPCDWDLNVDVNSVSHTGCDVCPDTRDLYNSRCVPKCDDDNPLRGTDNKCYPCDTEERVLVIYMEDACKICPNERKLDGYYCVLK